MCWYESHTFDCLDWSWGTFREQCAWETRVGETCGIRLIHSTIRVPKTCAMCLKIERKQRRLKKCLGNIRRWSRGQVKREASIDAARQEAASLSQCIVDLHFERIRTYQDVTNARPKASRPDTGQTFRKPSVSKSRRDNCALW